MAWRFKASKYKNSAPIIPKPEMCIRDIVVGSYQTFGNNITASAKFMAFNWEHVGSSLAVLPLDDFGRKSKTMPLLHAHSDTVTDLEFSPFHDGLLATASQDCSVKIWQIPEKGLEQSLSDAECTFNCKQRRVETVGFHPTADCLLYSTAAGSVTLWDLTKQKEFLNVNNHTDIIQSLSWKQDGTIFTTSCKDKMLRIVDPRSDDPITATVDSHQNIKDSRAVWLGSQDRILTTGFDSARLRQVIIRDVRNLSVPQKVLELDCSTGILIPLFDPDTNMLFLAGKGDTTISFQEVADREPFLIEGLRHSGEQTKGACLVPKRALRVMEGEVNRVLQLTSNSMIPIMYQVPRKTYRDFHSDIFPDTNFYKSELLPADWFNGKNIQLKKFSLDPANRELGDKPITPRLGPKPFSSDATETSFDKVFAVPSVPSTVIPEPVNVENAHTNTEVIPDDNSNDIKPEIIKDTLDDDSDSVFKAPINVRKQSNNGEQIFENSSANVDESEEKVDSFDRTNSQRNSIADRRRLYENRSQSVLEEKNLSPTLKRRNSLKNREEKDVDSSDGKKLTSNGTSNGSSNNTSNVSKRTSTVFGKVSKFRHLKGTTGHKSTHIENIKNISRQISGECDGFHANPDRVAVPLSGAGGKIAIFELNKTGRLPDGVIPSLVNGSNIMDFQWNPFDNTELAVACDDGCVKLWVIPNEGLAESTNTPTKELVAHSDKIYSIKYHPLAKNVMLSASYDMTIKLWDLETMEEKYCLKGHTDQIFSLAWSPCGSFLATVCKDGKIRIYDPRKSKDPIKEGIGGPIGSRGARITYALEGDFIVVTGFDKVSERQIYVFKLNNLNNPIGMVGLDVSPAILIPFYDEDSSTLLLTGKGDSTIYTYEVTEEAPFLCPLSHHRCASLHQGLSFLPKNQCDVSIVEFAKCLRLTNNSVEPLSFTVPRLKTEFFQDDLFPPTRITWTETLTSKDWYSLKDKKPLKINLKPEGMELLSSIQPTATTNPLKKIEAGNDNNCNQMPRQWTSEVTKAKQEEIKNSVSARMELNYKLEQDEMEGVDAKEWED